MFVVEYRKSNKQTTFAWKQILSACATHDASLSLPSRFACPYILVSQFQLLLDYFIVKLGIMTISSLILERFSGENGSAARHLWSNKMIPTKFTIKFSFSCSTLPSMLNSDRWRCSEKTSKSKEWQTRIGSGMLCLATILLYMQIVIVVIILNFICLFSLKCKSILFCFECATMLIVFFFCLRSHSFYLACTCARHNSVSN